MAGTRVRESTRVSRQQLTREQARVVGLAGFVAAVVLPLALWHRAMGIIASDFRIDAGYLVTGWTGYALIGAGLLFFIPVVWSIGQDPEGRYYPRSRNAYAAWGVCLYLLGLALASQVAAVARVHTVP